MGLNPLGSIRRCVAPGRFGVFAQAMHSQGFRALLADGLDVFVHACWQIHWLSCRSFYETPSIGMPSTGQGTPSRDKGEVSSTLLRLGWMSHNYQATSTADLDAHP